MAVEGRSVKQRIYHIDMGEVEVYQFFGKVWGWEAIPNGTKMSGFCQMDALPF